MIRSLRTATAWIAVVTSAVWLLTVLIGMQDRASVILGVIPARLSGLLDITPAVPAWLTPLSSTLAHGGMIHLALNMLMLVWCGTKVERVLGAGGLITLYVVGAYAAAIAQWLVDPVSVMPMIGASGAISAVVGACPQTSVDYHHFEIQMHVKCVYRSGVKGACQELSPAVTVDCSP